MQSKSERDIPRFSPPVCKFLSAIFPPARWRAEDQNLGLIYTSPGRCCQPASDWSLQITWPGHWPVIGSQLTSDCCIIPGVPGPAPRQFSLTRRGNFTVNSQWCTELQILQVSILISTSTQCLVIFTHSDVTRTQCLDIYQATLKLQPDMDKAFGGKYLLSALQVS